MGTRLKPSNLTVTAATAGEIAGGEKPYSPEYVRELFRADRFPSPIDPELHPRSWRWSRPEVEKYAAGEWVRPPATGSPGEPLRLPRRESSEDAA